MRTLLNIAFSHSRHFILLTVTLISMGCMTIATQMEILTMGIIVQKGPTFFELFAPVEDGTLNDTGDITKAQLEERWKQLDPDDNGVVTKENAEQFLSTVKQKGLINRIVFEIEKWIPLSGNVRNIALLIAFVAVFKAISLFWYVYSTKIITIKVSRDLRQQFFEHIQSLPMEFYGKHNIGSLSSRVVTDALMIAEGIHAMLINYLQTPFTILTTLILCFFTSWKLTLIIFFSFPLILIPITYLARKIKKVARQLQKNQESFASVLIDFLSGIQTVKVFAMEDFSLRKYQEENERMAKLERKSARYDGSTRPIVHTIAMFLLAGALLYGLYILKMTVSEILVYCGLLWVFYEPIKKLAEENSRIQKGVAAADRMNDVLHIESTIQDHPNSKPIAKFEDSIEFQNVSFRYANDWVLKNVSFKIKKGQTIGIVGPTGSGKSTIVQLLPRLYEVTEGAINIDGHPLQSYTQNSVRELVGFVPQKPFLFLDTVAHNIAFGRHFSREQIEKAARQAHADEFIQQLPQKYDSLLAEGGKNLSGGQLQRLAIARALVKQAPILVLDEATSALDPVSENYIQQAIKELHGSVTQIIIAHRLSTIEDADQIIYLEQGQIHSQGTKDELLNNCPGFRLMWEMMNRSKESTHA